MDLSKRDRLRLLSGTKGQGRGAAEQAQPVAL